MMSPSQEQERAEQKQRIALRYNENLAPYIAPSGGQYRGDDIGTLPAELNKTFTAAKTGTVVIAICCHGDETGNFMDMSEADE